MVKISQSSDEPPAETILHGYIMYEPNADYNVWISFSEADPSAVTYHNSMDTSLAAAYAGGNVYGYLAAGQFYVMNAATDEVVYPGLPISGFVMSMAYNHAEGEMYALYAPDFSNLRQIYKVNLAVGTLEYVADINAPEGVMQAIAIDGEGSAYGLKDGTDAGLYSIDLATGECAFIGATGLPFSNNQSIVWDHGTNRLFWARYSFNYEDYTSEKDLCLIDPATGEATSIGVISNGAQVSCLWTENDMPTAPIEVPNFNITFIDGLTGEEILGGYPVPAGTVLNEADFPVPPAHTDYEFVEWNYGGEPIYADTVITARYRNIYAIGFYFETDPAEEYWYFEDEDGDGYNWEWYYDVEGMPAPEGLGMMNSQSYDNNTWAALTPDNWL